MSVLEVSVCMGSPKWKGRWKGGGFSILGLLRLALWPPTTLPEFMLELVGVGFENGIVRML